MLQSSSMVPLLLQSSTPSAIARRCQQLAGLWTSASAAATASSQAGGASEQQQQQPSVVSQPPQTQDTLQQQQQQQLPATGTQPQPQQQLSSLHEQVLYELPGPGQPIPRLPSFRPRQREQKPLHVLQALNLVKRGASGPGQTVEAHMRLKVDPRRSDQLVRGAAVMPHSWQKGLRIAVFAEGRAADDARAAGAHVVGSAELVASILDSKGKDIDFTACLATPDMMPQLVKLGRILGPKGLMPSPKMGTLTEDIVGAIAELKQGRVEFRMDRTGNIHAPIGKAYFEQQDLFDNVGAFTGALLAAKPEAFKGGLVKFVRTAHLATTMGLSVPVDVGSLAEAVAAAAAMRNKQKAAGAAAGL